MNTNLHPTPIPTSRRHFIRLLSGGVVLAAGAAGSGCSAFERPASARRIGSRLGTDRTHVWLAHWSGDR
ncbi:hypothetical protein [Sphaerotilus sp.]|uniref:hypothetical protein n=1 Tax=Sphaerotilus sp. TaxID=2093942 RepID=UPI002ACEEE4B|nr:hypothetical protein [Sphaerotilus sp.]MDZ7856062.1 hypothetical protein [Sphaerotilus sp.]